MLSKGKKVTWFCPLCNSTEIIQVTLLGQNSGSCNTCHKWWPWRSRIKRRNNGSTI